MAPTPQIIQAQQEAAAARRVQLRRDCVLHALRHAGHTVSAGETLTRPSGSPSALTLTPQGMDEMLRVFEKGERIAAYITSARLLRPISVTPDDVMNWSPTSPVEPQALTPQEIGIYRDMAAIRAPRRENETEDGRSVLACVERAHLTAESAEQSRSRAAAGMAAYIRTEIAPERIDAFCTALDREYGCVTLPGSGTDTLADITARRRAGLVQWRDPFAPTYAPYGIGYNMQPVMPEGYALQQFQPPANGHSPRVDDAAAGEALMPVIRRSENLLAPFPPALRPQEVYMLQRRELAHYQPCVSPDIMQEVREAIAPLGFLGVLGGQPVAPADGAIPLAPAPRQAPRHR